jgi:hypothetical protein
VIQAGQSIHLRVLPYPPWCPSQRSRPPPCRWPTTPSPANGRGAGPGRDRAAVALASRAVRQVGQRWAGGGSGPGGYPPRPGGRGWPCRPYPDGAAGEAREAIADPASQCRRATRNAATTTAPKTTTTTTTQIHSGPTMALLLCLVGARRHDPGTSTASGRSPG